MNMLLFSYIKPSTNHLLLRCDDLPADYVVAGVHFHWGKDNSVGSEHWLRGRPYPLEMHIVGYNSLYASFQEALGKDKGIHVVGVFYQVSMFSNLGLKTCIDELRNVTHPGDVVSTGQFDFSQLLPESTAPYYRYDGSLTTPPCTENIVWSIFETPQDITAEQMDEFRKLSFSVDISPYTGGNVRPLQELMGRTIFTNNAIYSRK
ncbi:carbonic anhydrase 1-like [Physella acuta]|uniref:carbonic anhydrase 1-like n=1 Tax=Physella acuta TaxID=109671 RepID=UPI0027DBDFF5|nr:carbonic anhydrase 1-like [Physella acuta]